MERALSRFIAKTCGKTHSLFTTDDTNLFPLISCADTTVHAEFNTNLGADSGETTVQVPAYVNALLFRDQIFEEYEYKPKKAKKNEQSTDNNKKTGHNKTPIKDIKKETTAGEQPESDNEKVDPNAAVTNDNNETEQEDIKDKVNQTKIKGGCQSGRKVVAHDSKGILPLRWPQLIFKHSISKYYDSIWNPRHT